MLGKVLAKVLKTAANCPQAFGRLGYNWGHGEVVSLRSLPNYKYAFVDVCVSQVLMELGQHLLQLWPMPPAVFPVSRSIPQSLLSSNE